jgi:hypothetical protein
LIDPNRIPCSGLPDHDRILTGTRYTVFHPRLIIDRAYSGEQENRALAALRDALLPKLISGELRVPDAERFMEAIT